MRVAPVIALTVSLGAATAITLIASLNSATASGAGGPSVAPNSANHISKEKREIVSNRSKMTTNVTWRKRSATRGRLTPTGPRVAPPVKRSDGASTRYNLPPNLGAGAGMGL
jgi:hypothetical protein